jgi:nucleotide-binding universal stress UspA family protein
MSFKDLLVFVDALPGGDERLDLAANLARRHDAHLTAVHVVRPPEAPGKPDRVYFETILPAALEQPQRDAEALEAAFVDRLRRDGLLGEWRVIRRDSRRQPAVHARYADLIIAGQVREHSRAAGAGAVSRQSSPSSPAARSSSRPMRISGQWSARMC